MRTVLAMIALLILAACGGGSSNSSAPAAPVATAKAPPGKQWTEVYTKTGNGWVKQGNPDAPIKVVEYGSRSCPVCGNFAATGVEPLRAKYVSTGQVSYEFRDFLIHQQDPGIALLGRCVSTDAFFPVLDAMYANQAAFNDKAMKIPPETLDQMQKMTALDQARTFVKVLGYDELMKQSGISDQQVQQCLNQPAFDEMTKQMEVAANDKKVGGTPTFFVNDKVVDGPSWSALEAALIQAGAH
jgi:protein-disulfide isomerase